LVSLASAGARAQPTDQCIAANSAAQSARHADKFAEAKEKLIACANEQCPSMIRSDCTKLLNELEQAQPTIVFDAKDASGEDVSAVHVTVDGRPLADKLDGKGLDVDPGEHKFEFSAPGMSHLEKTFVIKEGEKNRRERIDLGAVAATPPAPAAPPQLPTSPTGAVATPESDALTQAADARLHQRVAGFVAVGTGVVGIALGTVFGLMTLSEASQQQSDCASATMCDHPTQAASDHSTAARDRAVSAVAFIGGGVMTFGGVLLLVTAGSGTPSAEAKMRVLPTVGPAGGGMLVKGTF
jgi:hypothetical protein